MLLELDCAAQGSPLEALRDAEGHAEVRAVTLIAAEMPKDWKAAAWYLERKFHDRWGRRERQDVTMTEPSEDLLARLDRGRARIAAAARKREEPPE